MPAKRLSMPDMTRSGEVSGIAGRPSLTRRGTAAPQESGAAPSKLRSVGFVDELGGVRFVEEAVRVNDPRRYLLAVGVGHERIVGLRAEMRAAFHRGAELSVDDSLQRIA